MTNTHRLVLIPSGRQSDLPAGIDLLAAARQLGVELESICGGRQTCGKCLVTIETGTFPKHGLTSAAGHLTPPEARERECATRLGLDLAQQRLACGAQLIGDALITVPESSQTRRQVIRKSAGAVTVAVQPAVRLAYVEVPPAQLDGHADAERLTVALAEQAHCPDCRLPYFLLPKLPAVLRRKNGAATATLWQNHEVLRLEPGYVERLYGIAIDIGSTTLAGHLCDLRTGAVLATAAMMNPQIRYGEDVISRITYATQEPRGLARLHRAIVEALNALCREAANSAGIAALEIVDAVLVGNTVMCHLALGISPAELGHLPFAPAVTAALDLQARDIGLSALHRGARVHLLPCLSGYVGADAAAVLLAEYPHLDERITLIVDIGTNAEILLGTKDRLLATSSPTGPALEGAQISHGQRAAPGAIERVRIGGDAIRYQVVGDERWSNALDSGVTLSPTGICGSGIIEVIGELLNAGLIDSSGRFASDAAQRHPCIRRSEQGLELVLATAAETATGQAIMVTQHDIRAVQLAKGALYSGAQLLLERLGADRIERVRLAGAFGSVIDPYYARRIGLIPDCDLTQAAAIGNAAGDGARIALLNWEQRRFIQELIRRVEYVETAAEPAFQERFMAALRFPSESLPE